MASKNDKNQMRPDAGPGNRPDAAARNSGGDHAAAQPSGGVQPPVKKPRRRIPRGRLWLYRIIAATLIPALLFLAVEFGLRWSGFGEPTDYLIPSPTGQTLLPNPKFGWRFFPKQVSREPGLFVVRDPKPENTYRIVVLGGSAALGFPDSTRDFGTILQVMLSECYPQTRFEVINAAMTAINSHVVLSIAQEMAEYEPDLFVVYLGNNEVVGPFGPGTAFLNQNTSRTAIRLNIWLKSLKVGQLVGRVMNWSGGGSDDELPETWQGMAMFTEHHVAADDARLTGVYRNYLANLRDIVAVGRAAGAETILCTVAVNTRDSSPFASVHRADLSEPDRKLWDAAFDQGVRFMEDGRNNEAVEAFERALTIDDRHAALRWCMAHCLEAMEAFDRAREHHLAALELDVLRFRADESINGAVRAAAETEKSAHLVDTMAAFQQAVGHPTGLAGRELFHEHVHMNFRGNYVLARAVFDQVESLLPSAVTGKGRAADVPPIGSCAQGLALTAHDRLINARALASAFENAPFSEQVRSEQRLAAARALVGDLTMQWSSQSVKHDAVLTYRSALERRPDQIGLHMNFAGLLMGVGLYDEALKHYQYVDQAIPDRVSMKRLIGVALSALGRYPEANASFEQALALSPNSVGTLVAHTESLVRQNDLPGALARARQIAALQPTADGHLRRIAQLLVQQGESDAAEAELVTVINAGRESPALRVALAEVYFSSQRFGDAVEQLEKAVELDPANERIAQYLADVRRAAGQP